MWNLFLDDERVPSDNDKKEYTICRSTKEAIEVTLTQGCPKFVRFDHDLGNDDTGMAYARFICSLDMDKGFTFIPKDFEFEVHSQNPIGKANIERYLRAYLRYRGDEIESS